MRPPRSPFRTGAIERRKAEGSKPQVEEESRPTPDTNESGANDDPIAATEAAARTLGFAPRPLPLRRRPAHAALDPFRVVQGRAVMVEGPPNSPVRGGLRRRDCACHLGHPGELCLICSEAEQDWWQR